MTIIKGKKIAEDILMQVKRDIQSNNLNLCLAVVQVGDDPVSNIFINEKRKSCQAVGLQFKLCKFGKEIGKQKLKKEITALVEDQMVSGIILQLPLPKRLTPEEFLNLIPIKKDLDVLSLKSFEKFRQGKLAINPPVVAGVLTVFKKYRIKLKNKNIVIIGAGRLVGKPLAAQFLREKLSFSVVDLSSKNSSLLIKKADIVVSGVGRPGLIKGSMIKQGVVIIDAGTKLKNGKISGDVDFESVSKKVSFYSPVPGGIGPLTVAFAIKNLIILNKDE